MKGLDILYRIHSGLPRQGPGSTECTARAFRHVNLQNMHPLVLDIGCGSGASALVLSRLTGGTVVAVDNHQPFLVELKERAWALQGPGRKEVQPLQASMSSLPFLNGSFDLIWSEGAAYLMGFEEALLSWRPLLKREGFLVVSEVTWLECNPPEEIRSYWEANYPAIASDSSHIETIARSGYVLHRSFTLPESTWWNYYRLLQGKMRKFRREYADDPVAQSVLDEIDEEIGMYENYHGSYGYRMYVMEKRDD